MYTQIIFFFKFFSGGSCALVTLFLLDRVYVSNAGDCRACIYEPSKSFLIPMSYDFTPESDRQRIQLIAFQRPELLRHPITKEKLYNRHVLSRKVICKYLPKLGYCTIFFHASLSSFVIAIIIVLLQKKKLLFLSRLKWKR